MAMLTINSRVPHDAPGEPVMVFYDHGDFEIAFNGDVEYIRENSNSEIIGVARLAEVISDLNVYLGDTALAPEKDGSFILFVSGVTVAGDPDEAVIEFTEDGSWRIVGLAEAEAAIEDGESYNFITMIEVLADAREFVSYHRDDFFDGSEEDRD